MGGVSRAPSPHRVGFFNLILIKITTAAFLRLRQHSLNDRPVKTRAWSVWLSVCTSVACLKIDV